ncbi:MAG: glutamate-5-semialdehyde dehydrogenase [Oscillospiraceae bacterium]|nr:glutamate-5-semialdehyde dehydrogenase [Oscillospiraceae bacterium]
MREEGYVMYDLEKLGERAKKSSRSLALLGTDEKNKALAAISAGLKQDKEKILAANRRDLENAEKSNMPQAMRDRLLLTESRISSIAAAVLEVAALPDPVGKIEKGFSHKNGMQIIKKTVPFGVIGVIYESRPNVTADVAVLCLKSGSAVILRGGSDAFNSNMAIAESMRAALESAGLDPDYIQLVEDTGRAAAERLMKLDKYLDLLIPRGGAGLISSVVQNSTVPVIETGTGNCHLYVEKSADVEMALNILENSKCSRVSVCNSLESLLVDEGIAAEFLPLAKARLDAHNVEWRVCEKCSAILGGSAKAATESDYATEFLDYIISAKAVSGIDEAIEHIGKYSTHHSDAIVTRDYGKAQKFLNEVDSAAVYVNASTRFTDGGEFGFGAEIGISTQKLHARGPMGIEALCSYKYIIYGDGQVR